MDIKNFFGFIYHYYTVIMGVAIVDGGRAIVIDRIYNTLLKNMPKSLTLYEESCHIEMEKGVLNDGFVITLPRTLKISGGYLETIEFNKIRLYETLEVGEKTVFIHLVKTGTGYSSKLLELQATHLYRISISMGFDSSIRIEDLLEELEDPYAGLLAGALLERKLKISTDNSEF